MHDHQKPLPGGGSRNLENQACETIPQYPAGITLAEAKAMMSTALNIFDRWSLSEHEARILLGNLPEPLFQKWKTSEVTTIPADTIWRLGNILGIHKALRSMFTDPVRGYQWIKRPSSRFDGKSALEVMLAGDPASLPIVRNYLEEHFVPSRAGDG